VVRTLPQRHTPWSSGWRVAQALGLLATIMLVIGLFLRPAIALDILWNGLVPVLPAVFLIHPGLWRNVCPLATLTMLPGGTRSITGRTLRATLIVGAVLLIAFVVARRVGFNSNGPAIATGIVGLAVAALAGGWRFEHKAGFCNTICPVAPVERLYGQRPLLRVANSRCRPCVLCTSRGCLDRSRADALRTAIGQRATTASWLHSPFGYFAAAFPGLIVGYSTIDNRPFVEAPAVVGHVLLSMVVSLVIVGLLVRGLRIEAHTGLPLLAALSAGLYYWYGAPVIVATWHLPEDITWIIWMTALILIAAWLRPPAAGRRHSPRELLRP
jgi:nitrite reductase (NADH) large subunit